jgi:uncharacterized protein (TIGR00369 family)
MAQALTERDARHVRTGKNYCFGCGQDNPDSMRMKFKFDEAAGLVFTQVRLNKRYTGPPGYCHGGIIATMLDEAMAKLNKLHGVTAVTWQITVDYLKPVPIGKTLRIEAHETGVHGRQRHRSASISNQKGDVLARGQGVFITVNPEKVFAK